MASVRQFFRAFGRRLAAISFMNEAMLFGAGVLTSLLPFLVLLSEFANHRVDDDLERHLGLDHRAANIVSHLFTQSSPSFSAATVASLVIVAAGTIAVVSSLQQVYEKVFEQEHRGARDFPRIFSWMLVLLGGIAIVSIIGQAVETLPAGAVFTELLMFLVTVPFIWWTMHFLLAGRVPWSTLLPSAVATGIFGGVLAVFSHVYFSSSIISDDKTYGPIGAVLSIATWLIAVGAVLLLGAVAGPAWEDTRSVTT